MESLRNSALASSLSSLNFRDFWKNVASSKSAGPKKRRTESVQELVPKTLLSYGGVIIVLFSRLWLRIPKQQGQGLSPNLELILLSS